MPLVTKKAHGRTTENLVDVNDNLLVAKSDEGLSLIEDLQPYGSELYSPSEQLSIPSTRLKIGIYEFSTLGRPPLPIDEVYFMDEDDIAPGSDPDFLHDHLMVVRNEASLKGTPDAIAKARQRKLVNVACVVVGVVVFALSIFGSINGFRLGADQSGSVVQTLNTAPETYATPTPSIPIEGGNNGN